MADATPTELPCSEVNSSIENWRPLGHSMMLQWDRELGIADSQRYGVNKDTRKHCSENFSRVLVYASGERLLGFPGRVPDATNIMTTCSIRFNVSGHIHPFDGGIKD